MGRLGSGIRVGADRVVYQESGNTQFYSFNLVILVFIFKINETGLILKTSPTALQTIHAGITLRFVIFDSKKFYKYFLGS